MDYLQDALNRYRQDQLKFIQSEYNKMPDTTLSQHIIKLVKENELKLYKNEAFDGDGPLRQKPRHAVLCVQCPPPPEFADERLSHINCTRSVCPNCLTYKQLDIETRLGISDRKIFFYYYILLPTCLVLIVHEVFVQTV